MSPHLIGLGWHLRSLLWPAFGSGLDIIWKLNCQLRHIEWGLILKLSKRLFSWRSPKFLRIFSISSLSASLCYLLAESIHGRGSHLPPAPNSTVDGVWFGQKAYFVCFLTGDLIESYHFPITRLRENEWGIHSQWVQNFGSWEAVRPRMTQKFARMMIFSHEFSKVAR